MTTNLDDRVFIRREQGFVPADIHADEMMARVKIGAEVILSIRSSRNPKHHRKLFGLLKVVCENSTTYSDPVLLLHDLKVVTGHCTTHYNHLTGEVYPEPQSISYESMSQARFDAWYALALEKMSEHIGTDVETLAQEVWAITEQKAV